MFTDGYIFVCNDSTVEDCFSNALFGAPRSGWREVSEISDTTAIFLVRRSRIHRPIMYGVFVPNGRPELNINPSVWDGRFPSQVKVRYWYKFSSSPRITFMTLWNRNRKFKRIGLKITQKETRYLITKSIINTRFHLSHQVRAVLGDLGSDIQLDSFDEKLQIHLSMCWLKKLACKDELECQFRSEFMRKGGNINDFINAVGVMGYGKEIEDIILYLRRDWQIFLKLVTKLEKFSAASMAEISSLLRQRSQPISTRTNRLRIERHLSSKNNSSSCQSRSNKPSGLHPGLGKTT